MAANQSVDLLKLFSGVSQALEQNRGALNKADSGNGNHGDNMVEIFDAITQAMKTHSTASPADQLEHAARMLRAKQSGSAQVYAQNLGQAAQQFQGQQAIDPAAAIQLIQTLLGGEAAASGGQDPLMGMLGGLLGGGQPQQQGQPQDAGLDMGDLLSAGMAFMSAKGSGKNNAEAAIEALLSAGPLGQSEHRKQSGQLVASTLLDMLGNMSGDK